MALPFECIVPQHALGHYAKRLTQMQRRHRCTANFERLVKFWLALDRSFDAVQKIVANDLL